MFEYYNNTLCVQAGWLVGTGVMSFDNYKQMSVRSIIQVLRRACKGTPALVRYDNMPERFKAAIKAKVGDPYKQVSRNAIKEFIRPDAEAFTFFSNYRLPDGRPLKPETVTEYHNNAMILDAVTRMLNDTRAFKKVRGHSTAGVWQIVADAVNSLDQIEYPHTLPACERRLRERHEIYKKDGYTSLIHKNFCNQHTRKVTADLERLILSIYCKENKPYASWVCDTYLEFLAGITEIIDMQTGEQFDRNDFYNDRTGEPVTISEATAWNYINNPANRALMDAMRMENHRYVGTVRPHYHRHNALFGLSKISLDDRDLPRKMHDGSRVKAYYAYDVASGALIGTAYSKSKDAALFIECIRDMFRFIDTNNWGMPMEMEVEHHIVGLFKDDLMKAGVVFPFVRWCAPGNSQEKHAEQLNRQKKYGYEKRYQEGIGRFYAKLEANTTGGERVYDEQQDKYIIKEKTYTFEQLVADDREMIARYNNGKHRDQKKHKDKTRLQVLQENINPNLSTVNRALLLRYIGECTTTSIVRNMYVQVQYAKYMLANPSVLSALKPNNYTVNAYYLPAADGEISSVHLYQDDEYICEAAKIITYNTAAAERTEADTDAMTQQAKYITSYDKIIKDGKQKLAKVKTVENTVDFEAITPELVLVNPAGEAVEDFENIAESYNEEYTVEHALDSL